MADRENGQFYVPCLAIVGVGLIGGSLAMSLKQHQRVGRVLGVGRSRRNLQLARDMGVIDEIVDDPASAAGEADIVVLATPVNTIGALFTAILPALTTDKVVTDVGSVKTGVCDSARQALDASFRRFVAGHPVAGKEKSGVAAATAGLFENHNVVLTPAADTDTDAIRLIDQMWTATGARVTRMDAGLHDRVLSMTSHLPHVLAYAMVDLFAASENLADCYDMAAGGFYDFTRTASSDPEMWRDICLMNRKQLLLHIDQFADNLSGIRCMIEQSDGDALEKLFATARQARSMVAERRKQTS